MEDRIADLSGSLGEAFADTISRIQRLPTSRSRVGMSTLMWLCHTTRAMTEAEVSDVLAIRSAENEVNVKYRPTTKTILECCQGLATVDGEGRIRLAHYAVQEYLQDHSLHFFPRAEATIAVTCLRYLAFKNFQDGPWSTWFEIESKMKMFPFLSWAAMYWGRFTRQTESDPEVWSTLFTFFSSPAATAISNQVRQYSMPRNSNYWDAGECRSFTALHHASRHGLERALNRLIDSGAYGVNELTQMGSTPIIHAAAGGHVLTTRGLLAHGADPYLINWYGNALHCAAEANKAATVRELVLSGMDPNTENNGSPYLVSALDNDAAGAFAALVELGADIESQSASWGQGHIFFGAAFMDCDDIVALMLERNWAEIEMRDPSGYTALHCATLGGAVMTVRRLVEAGANIDAMDYAGLTALELAELEGNRTIAKLLRDYESQSPRLS
jgi:ankyrin repeat protein